MAVIKPSETVSKIAGSVGKHVYSSWRGKSYMRSKSANRSNPSSSAQSVERSGTSALSKSWNNTLSDSQRALWNELAQFIGSASMDTVNREPGSRSVIPSPKKVMSGYNAFMRYNLRLIEAGIRALGNPLLSPSRTSPIPPTHLVGEYLPYSLPNFALSFDGVNEHVNLGDVLDYDFNDAQSWEFWTSTRQPLANDQWIIKVDATGNDGYAIFILNRVLYWNITRWGAGEALQVSRAFDLPDQFHHVVCSYVGGNSTLGMRIWVDSVLGQVSVTNVPITASILSDQPLYFAGWPPNPATYALGLFDSIRNYNRGLVVADIPALWNGGAGLCSDDPFSDGSCQGSWPVARGHNSRLYDRSGNNYHGDLINMEPADWVAGHIPCPETLAGVHLEWNDPDDAAVGARIRVWLMSYNAHVHKQLVATVALTEERFTVQNVRIAKGRSAPIGSLPGNYLFQIDCVGPNGGQSGPSNTIEVTVP